MLKSFHLPYDLASYNSHKASHSTYCAAPNCFNSRGKNTGLSFYGFPKDRERCQMWIINCRRSDLEVEYPEKVAGKLALCEEHFEHAAFMNPKEKGTHKRGKRLVHNAVPTLFRIANPPPSAAIKPAHQVRNKLCVPNKNIRGVHHRLKPGTVPSVINRKSLRKSRPTKRNGRYKGDQDGFKEMAAAEGLKEKLTSFRWYPSSGDGSVLPNLQDAMTDFTFVLRTTKGHNGADLHFGTNSSTRCLRDRNELMPTHKIYVEQ